MTNNLQQAHIDHFLKHQQFWGVVMMIGWFAINVVVLATTTLMEFQRSNKPIAVWEPFCWEISSILVILLLIPVGIYVNDHWLGRFPLKPRLLLHALATIPFSIVHILGMVSIRELWYRSMSVPYHFGDLSLEFLYEYRKDAQSYLTISLVIIGYRLIVRRLQGEASYLAKGDEESEDGKESELSAEPPPERLLIKKLGREFLIQTSAIEWIEASGNYANLHIGTHIYPMRITMEKLEKRLPAHFVRIHRSTIVNMEFIEEIQPLDSGDYQVVLRTNKTLMLSRRYRESFKSLLSLS